MPCYTVQTMMLNLENPKQEYLDEVAKALGLQVIRSEPQTWLATDGRVRYELRNGRFLVTGPYVADQAKEIENRFKKAYTTAIVKTAATQYGWAFSQAKDGKIYLQNAR